jgi:4-hydroxy-tetrahydrodipicolinate synthase
MPTLGRLLTAMVTPFDDALRVDEEGFVRVLHHLHDHGSDGVVVAGSTGESATLSDDELVRLVKLAVAERPKGMTVVAGAGSNSTAHAVELTDRVTRAGADGVLSVTPYYVKPNRRGIVAHFREVARATDRPVVVYNIPSRTATDMPNDLLAELAQIEHIDAVKQANNDSLALIDGMDVYAGNDDIFARTLDIGGAGVVSVAAHVAGDEMRRMLDEPEHRAEIDAALRDLFTALFVTTNPIPVKAALNLMGLDVGGLRLPLVEADEHEIAVVREALERHGVLAASA